MPASFRSFSSIVFVLAATSALLVVVIVVITGGFEFRVGDMRVSAHRRAGPLGLGLAFAALATVLNRRSWHEAAELLDIGLHRHATAVALIAASAAAAVAAGSGSYAAAGADAAGYLTQARLLSDGQLSIEEPLARRVSWPDATWTFAPLGYRPGPEPGSLVPTYPPGLPLTMAAAGNVGGPGFAFAVVPLFGALLVLATFILGVRLHSSTAALVAIVLVATSPIVLFHLVQPMSDVPATAWWSMAFALAITARPTMLAIAGLAAGMALLTRPNLVPLMIPLALLARGWPLRQPARLDLPARDKPSTRRTLGHLVVLNAAVLPLALFLAWIQSRLYGSVLASGYGSFDDLFTLANIPANLVAYTGRLLTGEWPALALLAASVVAAVAVGGLRLARSELAGPSTRLLAVVGGGLLVCYLPYGVFAEWSYLRFLMPMLPLLFVVIGAVVSGALSAMPVALRPYILLTTLAAVAAFNVNIAAGEQAFSLRRYEARYREAGEYAAASLPSHAVILAVQQSASARYYTGLPVVRWDLLRADLDAAVTELQALGRSPVLLVEDWEIADLRGASPNPRWRGWTGSLAQTSGRPPASGCTTCGIARRAGSRPIACRNSARDGRLFLEFGVGGQDRFADAVLRRRVGHRT